MSATIIHKAVSKSASIQASPGLQFRVYFNSDDVQIVRIKSDADVTMQRNYIILPYDAAYELGKLLVENRRCQP